MESFMKKLWMIPITLSFILCPSLNLAEKISVKPNFQPTNKEIYEALIENRIRLEKFETKVEARFREFEKHFGYIDKRFEDINKRFEDIDKRFEDINKRFEDINKRFEDMNRRFDDMFRFLYILAAIFTTLTATVIGFAYWDRKTILSRAKEETQKSIKELDMTKVTPAIESLKKLAKDYPEIAQVLKQFNLL